MIVETTSTIRVKYLARDIITKSNGAMCPFLGLEDIEPGIGVLVSSEIGEKAADDALIAQPGDVLFGKLRPYLSKSHHVDFNVTCTGEFLVLRANSNVDSRFLFYLTLSRPWLEWAEASSYGSKMPRTSASLMEDLRIPLLTKHEQGLVSGFLDRETGKIDALIDKQHQLIETLREDRTATITHAVTKGLNPEIEMQDFGPGFPGVPHNWAVAPLKRYLVSLNSRRIPLSSEERGGRQGRYPYYGASGVIDYVDDYLFDEELILVSEDGANLLTRRSPIAFTAEGEYWVNNHAHILKPIVSESPKFWAHRIESENVSPYVTGAAQPKLTSEAIMNLLVSVPRSVEERGLIEDHIEARCDPIGALLVRCAEMIDTLQEYRTALITAAVTGKIDVREAV